MWNLYCASLSAESCQHLACLLVKAESLPDEVLKMSLLLAFRKWTRISALKEMLSYATPKNSPRTKSVEHPLKAC